MTARICEPVLRPARKAGLPQSTSEALPGRCSGLSPGVGAALAIFGAIFAAHAAKVKAERSIECNAIPAANDSIAAIVQGVSSGTIGPADAVASLQQLWEDWQSQVVAPAQAQGVYHGNPPGSCDAICDLSLQLAAVIAKLSIAYANQAATTPAPQVAAQSIVATVSTATGLPAWAVYLGAGLLLFLLLD